MLVLTGDTAARLARVHRAGAATAGLGTGLAAALGASGALSAGLLVAAGVAAWRRTEKRDTNHAIPQTQDPTAS